MTEYPLIDRRDVKFFSDTHNIGFNEGVLSDDRPYRLECWAVDQITNITIFISTVGIENFSSKEVMTFLETERLFKVLTGGCGGSALKFIDKNGNEFWSANLVIGDDEDMYATSNIPLKPFEYHSEKPRHEKSSYHKAPPKEPKDEMFGGLPKKTGYDLIPPPQTIVVEGSKRLNLSAQYKAKPAKDTSTSTEHVSRNEEESLAARAVKMQKSLKKQKKSKNRKQPEPKSTSDAIRGSLTAATVLDVAARISGIDLLGNQNLLDFRKQMLPYGEANL